MSLDIQERTHEGITIFDLKGRITLGQEASVLRDMVERLESRSIRNLVLNMEHVEYVDSTGLGALVMCSTHLKNSNGIAKLVNVNRRNIELLVMTKLATVFEIFTDEQDAINSYFPDRKIQRFDVLDFVRQMKQESH